MREINEDKKPVFDAQDRLSQTMKSGSINSIEAIKEFAYLQRMAARGNTYALSFFFDIFRNGSLFGQKLPNFYEQPARAATFNALKELCVSWRAAQTKDRKEATLCRINSIVAQPKLFDYIQHIKLDDPEKFNEVISEIIEVLSVKFGYFRPFPQKCRDPFPVREINEDKKSVFDAEDRLSATLKSGSLNSVEAIKEFAYLQHMAASGNTYALSFFFDIFRNGSLFGRELPNFHEQPERAATFNALKELCVSWRTAQTRERKDEILARINSIVAQPKIFGYLQQINFDDPETFNEVIGEIIDVLSVKFGYFRPFPQKCRDAV